MNPVYLPGQGEWYAEALNDLHATIDAYPNSPCPWLSWEEAVCDSVRQVLARTRLGQQQAQEQAAAHYLAAESFPRSCGLFSDY